MIRKIKKVFAIAILIILMLFNYTTVNAFSIEHINSKSSILDVTEVNNFGQSIIKIISTIGSVMSVIILIILGIKYMMGSVEERAEYKKTLFPYVLGAGLLFAASTIASMIYNIATQI